MNAGMILAGLLVALNLPGAAAGQGVRRSYRLASLGGAELKEQRVIWGSECLEPPGRGLAFGGQDQDAEDGRPHTRVFRGGRWEFLGVELRGRNPLEDLHRRVWALRCEAKDLRARARFLYFKGLEEDAASGDIASRRDRLLASLGRLRRELAVEAARRKGYEKGQLEFALRHVQAAESGLRGGLRSQRDAQVHLALAAEALDAEPPPRALECGAPRRQGRAAPPARGIAYDSRTGLYVIFGGDHLDYLTNDTWVFDPARERWFQRHPAGAPPPRANHRLEARGDGTIRMEGGYTYASNTDYVGGQYADIGDGPWRYNIEKNTWTGGKLVSCETRRYRTGPFHPDFYLQGEKPDAAKFEAWLARLPANEWTATDPPYRPRLNRDWGTARIDPDRDMMLRWSGGHSAHGGTDVPHFHFSTNRWELPFAVEFPLGQLYSNTSYPQGFNFNLRPWMTGHTYQDYAYDPPGKVLVTAGRPRHYYVYDPDAGDWIGRGPKPPAMRYSGCFYDLTLTATPHGIVSWGKNGRVCRYDHAAGKWVELELSGDPLPGACVDNSTIAYDSRRDRILVLRKPYGKPPYDGEIYAVGMKTRAVKRLSPHGMKHAHTFAFIDRCVYDPENDLMILASYLGDGGGRTRTPGYDCAKNQWVTLDIRYGVQKRGGRTVRRFPHGRSCGIVYDPKRNLIWGTDTNSQVYVLRLDLRAAGLRALGSATHGTGHRSLKEEG